MVACSTRELVCLYLDACDGAHERTPAPAAVTAAGIGDALELGDSAASRVDLLDVLQALQADGFVTADERRVIGYDTARTVYRLTPAGRDRAATLRTRFEDASVEVTNGATETVPLAEIDRYFPDSDHPLVTALARLTDDGRVPLDPGDGGAFVDREDALATVRETIADSFTRESGTVIVGGAAGMGKTALVREAIDRVREAYDDLVVAAGSSPPGAADSYAALRQAFEAVPGGKRLLSDLAETRPVVPTDGADEVAAQRTALFTDVAEGLCEAATDQPIVLFLDNLHWADEATLDLFAHLATTVEEWVYPVAFVGAYRQPHVAAAEDHPLSPVLDRLAEAGGAREVTLDPLSRGDTRALLAEVVGRHQLPEGFVDVVHERTGGNPLFVRETATHLLESGRVDPWTDSYPTRPDAVDLPESVTDHIAARLRQLDDASRELLGLGAVIGERVPGDVLAAASDLPAATHREYVDLLVTSHLWTVADERAADDACATAADGPGARDLQFVSGGVREAVADRLPAASAEAYHRRVAEALVATRDDGRAARIAHHYAQAGDADAAMEYYRRAGDRARDTYAYEDARDQYRRALDLARDTDAPDETVAAIYADLADGHRASGAFAEAAAAARDGLAVAPERSRVRCRLLGILTEALIGTGEGDAARQRARTQRDLAADVDAPALETEALRWLGLLCRQEGEYEAAREHFEAGLASARERDDSEMMATLLKDLGGVAGHRGEYDRACDHHERALAIATDLDAPRLEAKCRNNLGVELYLQSEYDRARDCFERSLELFRDLGDRYGEAGSLSNLGMVARQQGEYEAGREYYERSLAIERDIGDRYGEARTRHNLGLIARQQGDYQQARDHHERSLELKRDLDDRSGEANSLGRLGLLARRRGNYEQARDYYERSLSLCRDLGDRDGEAVSRNALGTLARLQGQYDQAREHYDAALAIRRDIGDRAGEARTRHNLGALARVQDDYDEAREHYEASLEIKREVTDPPGEAATLANLGELARLQDEYDRAADRLDAAADSLSASDHPFKLAKVRLERALLSLARGDLDRARTESRAAHDYFEETGVPHWRARCRRVFGRIAAESDAPAVAREHWQGALATFTDLGAPQEALETLEHLVETCRDQGDDEAAREFCQRARHTLAEAPDATAECHRDWVDHHTASLGIE